MKGQLGVDIVFAPLLILFVAIVFLVGTYAAIQIFPKLIEAGNVSDTKAAQNLLAMPSTFNTMMWMILIAIGFTIIVTAWVLRAHPIFWGIGALSVIIGTYIAIVLQESVKALETTNVYNETATAIPASTFALNHIAVIVSVLGIFALTLSYIIWKKNPNGEGEFGT